MIARLKMFAQQMIFKGFFKKTQPSRAQNNKLDLLKLALHPASQP